MCVHVCVRVHVYVCVCECVCVSTTGVGGRKKRAFRIWYLLGHLAKLVPSTGTKIEKIQKHHKFPNRELALHRDEYIRKPDLKEPISQTKISELKRL